MQIRSQLKKAQAFGSRTLQLLRARRAVAEALIGQAPIEAGKYRIGVYFADGVKNIYQMRQWYGPLRELAQTHPVLLLARHPAGATALLQEAELPVAYVPLVTDLEQLVQEQPLDIIFYVNQNARNFQMLRYGQRAHVYINHGESDKVYMTTNQHKCYDYAFVAGEAAQQRLAAALWRFDVASRTIAIGRPQTDHLVGDPPFPADDRINVLYSPTWEGDRPRAAYSSVLSHGVELVSRLVATGRHRVIYRPHPMTGTASVEFAQANKRIQAILADANASDPGAGHVFDNAAQLGWQLNRTDIAICDVSAMVYDRLATGRPLFVTRPVAAEAVVDEVGFLAECDWLSAAAAADIVSLIDAALGDPGRGASLARWAQFYFGDVSPGAPTARFHAAIERVLAENEALKAGDAR